MSMGIRIRTSISISLRIRKSMSISKSKSKSKSISILPAQEKLFAEGGAARWVEAMHAMAYDQAAA